jgi:hypothetical protein
VVEREAYPAALQFGDRNEFGIGVAATKTSQPRRQTPTPTPKSIGHRRFSPPLTGRYRRAPYR